MWVCTKSSELAPSSVGVSPGCLRCVWPSNVRVVLGNALGPICMFWVFFHDFGVMALGVGPVETHLQAVVHNYL